MILQMISTFAKSFGFLSKMSNIKTPTTLIIAYIYGIEIDSRNLEPSFSLDKVDKVRIHLLNMQCKDKTNLYQLQSLIGPLIFACSVFVPGRAFLRHLIDLTWGGKKSKGLDNLTDKSQADIDIWLLLLFSFKGKSVFHSQNWFSRDHLYPLYR